MSDEIGGKIKALVFDVFGTVVDWRSSITREIKSVGKRLGVEANWETFADRWRAGSTTCGSGSRGWRAMRPTIPGAPRRR